MTHWLLTYSKPGDNVDTRVWIHQPWMRTLEDGFWVKVQVHYCWGYLGLQQGQNDSLHYTYIIRELTKTCRYQCQKTKISTWGQILFILHIALCHKRHQMTLVLSYLLPKHNYKTKYSKWSLRHMLAVYNALSITDLHFCLFSISLFKKSEHICH